ncbi:MAG: serine hydrolase, partial [Sedimentisphaerales bacterium]|nr:serine hydrolase [Sedimentisphaerales bacterium]
MSDLRTVVSLLVIISCSQCVFAGQGNFEWEKATPESQGMSSQKLDAARDVLAQKQSKTFLVIKNDKIVYEWYSPDFGPKKKHYTASMAKALVGGMSLMLALNDGVLNADDLACNYIPEWKGHPQKSKITIRHLATHSSGIEDAEQDNIGHFDLPGWKGQFWKQDPDPFTVSRDEAPVLFRPGSEFAYSNPGMAMLSYAVTAAEQTDIRTLLRERIMRPIGVDDNDWSIGYGKTFEVNGLNLVANWGGGGYTARATARVGRLMLRKGNWQGRQLVDPKWVEQVTKYAGMPLPDRVSRASSPRFEGGTPSTRSITHPAPASGLAWWVNFDGVWPKVPRDAFVGSGAG